MQWQQTLRILALMGTLAFAQAAHAGTITFYTDRASWLADAAAAGLDVATEDFSSSPSNLSDLVVGGVSISITSPTAVYDAPNQRIGYTSGGGRTLGFDITASTAGLFGFGLDLGPTIGNLRTTDLDGDSLADGGGGALQHFVGLLGTVALDPANPFPSNPALAFGNEFGTSGLALNVYLDDLSVATGAVQAPEPAALLLLGFGLVWIRLRRG